MYLIFDTETTGAPRDYKAPLSDYNNWPRMVQVAWICYDDAGVELSRHNRVIFPEGYTIPANVAAIHGITTEIARRDGLDLEVVLHEFNACLEQAKVLVAHNITFDEKIIGVEFLRKGIANRVFDVAQVCTMKAATNYCKLPGKYGFKWPNLRELHQHLFGVGFDNAHDASADVAATANCFFELKRLGVIT